MRIQENFPLRGLTTLKIGGTARYLISVTAASELTEVVSFAARKRLPLIILGGGSNVLITQTKLEAVVVRIEIRGVVWKEEGDETIVEAGAGESWDALVAESVRRGLWGLENLSGIPGTVGGAPIQNIGAYGTELKDVLEWVEVFDIPATQKRQGEALPVARFRLADCRLSYRESIFKSPEGKHLIVTRVALRLRRTGKPNLIYKDLSNYFAHLPVPTLSEIREAVIAIRSRKFPDLKKFGTAGSFFKNPIISAQKFAELKAKFPDLPGFAMRDEKELVKVSLAWVLDHICNLKGFTKGRVALFESQPIVLVNLGAADAAEVESFAAEVEACVKEKTGIQIEREVRRI